MIRKSKTNSEIDSEANQLSMLITHDGATLHEVLRGLISQRELLIATISKLNLDLENNSTSCAISKQLDQLVLDQLRSL